MRLLAAFFYLTIAVAVSAADISAPIPLWPKGPPDERGVIGKEADTTTESGRMVAGRRVIRLANVSEPTITVYHPAKRKANGTAVLVCPGGGYTILAMDLEGTEISQWLNSLGVTAVLLKYRVPTRTGDTNHILPLQDAQRALGLTRFHARDWKLDPHRIGVIGFSAGGHLMAHLCSDCERREYPAVDAADEVSCRPDFAIGIYPAYLVQEKHKTQLVAEIHVTSNTPPTFLAQTEDDIVHPECALTYWLALKNAKVPAELHLYPEGGHGYGLRPGDPVSYQWPILAEEWLRSRNLLDKNKP